MYILTAEDITKGVSAMSAGGDCCTPGSDQFNGIQREIRTRVEGCLEVQALARLENRDTFEVFGAFQQRVKLRLGNAFLTNDPVRFVDEAGEDLEIAITQVDRLYGIVIVTLDPGTYRVAYKSGFTVDGYNVFVQVPDWMKSIALATLLNWQRAMGLKVSKEVSHSALSHSLLRELHARVYERYMRPRAEVTYSQVHEQREDANGEWLQW